MAGDPTRVVADADVLAADLLVAGPDRLALDQLWQHSWTTLLASDPLLNDAHTIIATLSDDTLADDWVETITDWVTHVDHPATDTPGLRCALEGDAAHLLTHTDHLRSASTAAELRQYDISVKTPAAFHRLFDPATLYEHRFDDPYPGPDRSPRTDDAATE